MTRAERLARRTDPVSSHEAAREHVDSGRNASQRRQVLSTLLAHQGSTSDELARALGVSCYVPARRLPELESDGLVVRGDELRKSTVSGRRSVVWFAVEDGSR